MINSASITPRVPTNYLDHKLSKKLQERGLTSESGMWWVLGTDNKWRLLDTEGCKLDGNGGPGTVPAFTLFDILGSRENCIKLFGEEELGDTFTGSKNIDVIIRQPVWKWKARKILDLLHQGREDEIIAIIEKALT